MAKLRHRQHQVRREPQARQRKQIEAQLAELGGLALSQPIFLVASGGGGATVSRAMPGVLEGHMDDASWNSFCDKIDEALLPLGEIRKDTKLRCLLPLVILVPLVLFGLLATALAVGWLTDDEESMVVALLPVMLFSIAFLGSISLALGAANSSRRRARLVDALARTCYEASTSHPGVSFKVYDDLRYIQVIVAKNAPGALALDAAKGNSKSTDGDSTASGDTASIDTASIDAAPSDAPPALDSPLFHEETLEVAWELPLDGDGEGKNTNAMLEATAQGREEPTYVV